ncbi:hypothetical protein PSI9734_01524 [Pseudidiomarina piscicola]|uniref:DUF1543 domain-containing protein n=1 Tax=Pseudidiomarina piscicola TaxID=2614830 RepID=A0A6S6WNH2_9GAMM|nr:DUF1543 domain-containing protein [Pseudidiomarina piscicola]CAB0151109.1 hypothetical protein PSI9734_01524 [Pseudidiomarina piscicola]VZT40617.1 hypothetical protein PSI9734_01524 [Pseudomonas aeruginosa]
MKLYMFYIGGSAPGANIEVHDVRFVAGESVEGCYPALRKHWYGTLKGLHLDSYVQVHHVDGYRVELQQTASDQAEKLWFVNFGGYYPNRLAEFHDFTLVVAKSADEAKRVGYQRLLTDSVEQHKDDLYDVDNCLNVDLLEGWHVKLVKDGEQQPLVPDWSGYEVIA